MNLSIPRKALVSLILGVASVLWFIDQLYSYRFKVFFMVSVLIGVGYYSFLFGHFFNAVYDEYLHISYPRLPSYNQTQVLSTEVLSAFSNRSLMPKKLSEQVPPPLSAKSVYVQDASGLELYAVEADKILAPASTVKLLTALVALDIYDPEEYLVVSSECTNLNASMTGFPAGHGFSVESLLSSMLINSGADSACVLATSKVSVEEFIVLLNEKATAIGMQQTYITSPIGLDDPLGQQKTTAQDLMILAEHVVGIELLNDLVGKTQDSVQSQDGTLSVSFGTTNRMLLDTPHSVGIKTGTTSEAGQVLNYRYQDDTRDFIIVVMGSEDRFSDTKELLEWILEVYIWS